MQTVHRTIQVDGVSVFYPTTGTWASIFSFVPARHNAQLDLLYDGNTA